MQSASQDERPVIEPFPDPEVERRIDGQLLLRTPTLEVGRFRARPGDVDFRDSGPPGRYLLVFPHHAVGIEHENGRRYVGDALQVALYNPGDRYVRTALSSEGDASDWIALPGAVVHEAVRRTDAAIDRRGTRYFDQPALPVGERLHLRARLLVRDLEAGALEAGAAEEIALHLLDETLAGGAPGACSEDARAAADLTERARRVLARRFAEPLRLSEIARDVGSSVYHLCRTFRRQTGATLHGHRAQLRLRRAVDLILEGGQPRLADVAVEVGYAHHSHFTEAFRRAYGFPPSQLDREETRRRLRAAR